MELDDFVTETICRIMKGMADADKRLKAEKTGEQTKDEPKFRKYRPYEELN